MSDKPIYWIGTSKQDIVQFPIEIGKQRYRAMTEFRKQLKDN